ncbi:MAG: AraC family transcriptional regulator [Candidatus Dormiibacterota bacterium]
MAKIMCRRQDEVTLQALRQARDQLDRDYGSDITVSAIAGLAGYTASRFIRAFRHTYGETPGRYRIRRRIERARELLRASDLSVTEICLRVGFSSLGSFSSSFTRIVGLSPTQYRQEAARRGGAASIPACFVLMWQSGLPAVDSAVSSEAIG